MPPKKGGGKQATAKVQKVVDDKTFGLKNKNKSAKLQKYMQQVQNQASSQGKSRTAEQQKKTLADKKKLEEQKKAELAELFKPVQAQQKVPFGVNPKTVLCAFFKSGQCQKGIRCKFSHDLGIERKGEKIDLHTDKRESNGDGDDKENDLMDNWDQAKLEDVVASKHSSANKNNPTAIVCKYFLEAIENRKYGWFWECPNGNDKCKYRHALPPGYVLKAKETEDERREREALEKENEITLEDFLEKERHEVGETRTPITYETFAAWKERQTKLRNEEKELDEKQKKEAFAKMKAGMKTGMAFSGRELFVFNPEMANDGSGSDEEGAMESYSRSEEPVPDVDEGKDHSNTQDGEVMAQSISKIAISD